MVLWPFLSCGFSIPLNIFIHTPNSTQHCWAYVNSSILDQNANIVISTKVKFHFLITAETKSWFCWQNPNIKCSVDFCNYHKHTQRFSVLAFRWFFFTEKEFKWCCGSVSLYYLIWQFFYSITLLMASFLCNTDKTMLTRDTFSGCSIRILLFYFRENKQHLRRWYYLSGLCAKLGSKACGLVDECKYNNGECSQFCIDTYDSYYCTCRRGYRLAQIEYTCPGNWSRFTYRLLSI